MDDITAYDNALAATLMALDVGREIQASSTQMIDANGVGCGADLAELIVEEGEEFEKEHATRELNFGKHYWDYHDYQEELAIWINERILPKVFGSDQA